MKKMAIFAVLIMITSTIMILPNAKAIDSFYEDPEATQSSQTHWIQWDNSDDDVTQSFKPSFDNLALFCVYLKKTSGWIDCDAKLKIGTSKGGAQKTSIPFSTSRLGTSGHGGWYDFESDTDITFTPDQTYYMTLELLSDVNENSGELFSWGTDNSNPYNRGCLWNNQNGNWVQSNNRDATFECYMRDGNTKPTFPTIISPDHGTTFTIQSGETLDVELTVKSMDPDGDNLTYRFWEKLNGEDETIDTTGWIPESQPASVTWENLGEGTYEWYAKAGDGEGFGDPSMTAEFTIEIEQPEDTEPPIPNKSTWQTEPFATSTTSIMMTATQATDPNGVQYLFEETTQNQGGSNSDWQDSNTYIDNGLQADTTYKYRVKTRDKSINQNTGTWSDLKSAKTQKDTSNNPPFTPSNPTPSNNAESIDTNRENIFSWDGGDPDGDNVKYDFYLNVCPTPKSIPLILKWWDIENQKGDMGYQKDLQNTESQPVLLMAGQKYYWKVVATDENGAVKESPIWTFQSETRYESENPENYPPNKPSRPTVIDPIDPLKLRVGDFLIFSTSVVEPDGDNVDIYWDFDGDDNIDTQNLNLSCNKTHSFVYIWDKPVGTYNVRAIASDIDYSEVSDWSEPLFVQVIPRANNNPPNTPNKPYGEDTLFINTPYKFKTICLDPDEDRVRYQWDFGDGTITEWDETFWLEDGYQEVCSHIWENEGQYNIKVRAMDYNGVVTPWSNTKQVHVVAQNSATVYTLEDFTGAYFGDAFDLLPGQGRLIDAKNGTIVTGAYGGFPAGYAWSTACQGVDFYVGREKELTIDAELSYISGTEFLLPSYAWLHKVIRIDNFFEPKKIYKQGISNLISLEDIKTPTAILERAPKGGPTKPNYMHIVKPWLDKTNVDVWEDFSHLTSKTGPARKIIDNYASYSRMGKTAVTRYNALQNMVVNQETYSLATDRCMSISRMVSPTQNSGAVSGTTTLSRVSGIITKISLIITVAFQLWTLFQLMTHWNVEKLLDQYEEEGKAFSEHYVKKHTFEKGHHDVWAGIQSEAEGFLIFFGFAYAAGMVKSIKIDGIAPPEKPLLSYPDNLYAGQNINFRPYCFDQNDDPVKFIIDWGDGTITTTGYYDSEEEGLEKHRYTSPGTYTITIKSEDCDKLQSETKIYTITVQEDTNPPTVSIDRPESGVFFNDMQLAKNVPTKPLIIGDITLQASAEDLEEVKKVTFKINNIPFHTDTSKQYTAYCNLPGTFGNTHFQVTAEDYAGNTDTDTQTARYWNRGQQNMMVTQTEDNSPGNKQNYNIKIPQPEGTSQTEFKQGVDELRNVLNNDYNGAEITFSYDVDYGDGTPIETIQKQYPILQINHQYQDKNKHIINVTMTTTLKINDKKHLHKESFQLEVGKSKSKNKENNLNIFNKIFQRSIFLSKIIDILIRLKEKYNFIIL